MKKTIFFDIDNLIYRTIKSNYKKLIPILKNNKYINQIYIDYKNLGFKKDLIIQLNKELKKIELTYFKNV